MLGETYTGKTSLVLRFAEGRYRENSIDPTVGATFITKRLTVQGVTAKIQIWDTAGQEQFKRLAPMYYKNARAAILCYDVTSPKSFETLQYWMNELQQNKTEGGIVIAMCATKCDLDTDPDTSQADALAAQTGSIFMKTSSKTNSNVQLLFQKVMERVLDCHNTVDTSNINSPPLSPRRALNSDGASNDNNNGSNNNETATGNHDEPEAPRTSSQLLDEKKKTEMEDNDNVVCDEQQPSEDKSSKNINVSRCDTSNLMCGDVVGEDGSMGCIIQ